MLVTESPMARGLFQKAIVESGAALDLPGIKAGESLKRAEDAGAAFARNLGATSPDELRALPVSVLIAPGAPRSITSPIQDGTIVPVDITAAYRNGRDAGVPLLLGWNSNEAARFIDHATLAGYAGSARATYGPIAGDLLRLYPAANDVAATRAAQDLMSDVGFGWRSWSIAEAGRARKAAPVFLYQFDDPPPGSNGSRTSGAVHSDELGFVWGNDDPERRWSTADNALSDKIQRYWINFMRTGNPNGAGLPRWRPYGSSATALWLRSIGLTNRAPLRVRKLQAIDAIVRGSDRSDQRAPS